MAQMDEYVRAAVDLDEIAAELERDGVDAFRVALRQMLGDIEERKVRMRAPVDLAA
jgi:hypothetical protein